MSFITSEAQEIAIRSRGQMGSILNQDSNHSFKEPKPEPRVTSQSREYYERNKGVINDCLNGHLAPAVDRKIHPRGITTGGAEVAQLSKGGRMEKIVTYQGNKMPISSRGPSRVVKPEGEEFAERNKGIMSKVLHAYGTKPASTRDVKVYGMGREIAAKGQGPGMGPILRQENPLPSRDATESKPARLHGDTENWMAPSPRVYEPKPAPEPRQGPLHKDSENWVEHDATNPPGMPAKKAQNKFWQPSVNWPPDRNMGNFSVRERRIDPMFEKSDSWLG